jgi:predicted dehydrogenase
MDLIKFGIIGCGQAATFHFLGIKKDPNPVMEYTAAYDVNEKQLRRFSKRYKVKPFNNLEDFLHSDIDAVLICVPHYLHETMTKVVAEAGKHVICEKPMAPTLEECDKMISITKKAGVKFMIAENHRFLPVHKYMKQLLEQDYIGDVFLGRTYEGAYCSSEEFLDAKRWNFTFDKGGGGVVADQGVHKFTMLNWFLGKVDSAQCWCGKTINSPPNKADDTAIVLLRYKSGAMVSVAISSTTVHPLNNSTELQGTKGTIYEDHSWQIPLKVLSSHPNAEKKGEFYSPSASIEHGSYPQYYTISAREEDHHFAECILSNKNPEFSPEEAKEGVEVVLLSYLSAIRKTTTSMDDLKKVGKNEGTRSILENLKPFIQNNYKYLKW